MLAQSCIDTAADTPTLWDATQGALRRGDIFEAMEHLLQRLATLRTTLSADAWTRVTRDFLTHPVRGLVHEGPLTRSAFVKARGYAGDATTLDLIYGEDSLAPTGGSLPACLYQWEYQTQSCHSVRARRDLLAVEIDRTAISRRSARILSVACGHLREASLSQALRHHAVREFVALDQDRQSLDQVDRDYGQLGVRTVEGTVRGLLGERYGLGRFDLIYSAGLYDYLAQPAARRLTATLFRRLAPGGRLFLANFAPSLPDIGYLEACMDWRLTYRCEASLAELVSEIPASMIRHQRTYRDPWSNIVFLEVDRV